MWRSFVDFWNSLGWVANSIEIISAIFIVWIFIKKYASKKQIVEQFAFKNLTELVNAKIGDINVIKDSVVKNAKIAIVDDNPSDFPLEYLRKLKFDIDVIEKTSLTEYEKFSRYDLVMLDIAGVVIEDMSEGGLELIKRIDSLKKRPQIIAVSSKKFDPKASEFFSIADEVMSKPIRDRECEEAFLLLLMQKHSPYHAADEIDKSISISSIDSKSAISLYKTLFKYIHGISDNDATRKILAKKYAFMDVNKLMNNLDTIKSSIGKNHDK